MSDYHGEHRSVLTEEQLAPPLPGTAQLSATRWLILLEQNLRHAWRFYTVLGLFLSVAWLDLFSFLPSGLHLFVLAMSVVAMLRALWGTKAAWRLPSWAAAARRLESANNLQHFPYEALTAKPVNLQQDHALKTLWSTHQSRTRAVLVRLKLPVPQFGIHGQDPYYLRWMVGCLVVASLVTGHDELGARLQQALSPDMHAERAADAGAKITAWVTPPAYTGLAPIMLAEAGKTQKTQTYQIPAGSKIALRVGESEDEPVLITDAGKTPFTKAGEQSYALDSVIPQTTELRIKAGWFSLAHWPIMVVPDHAPQIAWAETPRVDKQQNVQLTYHAADDYGLSKVQLVMSLAVSAVGLPTEPQIVPLSGAGQKSYDGKLGLPLGLHLWAGMPVTLVAEAIDLAGQTGKTAPVTVSLPEHVFTDPLAQELAGLRKDLLLNHEANWKHTLNMLVALARDVPRYHGNPRILLGMRSTAVRMYNDANHTALTQVTTILWQMALALDTGGVAEAEERLRNAQQQLEQALANHADSATIQQKTAELEQAMMDYMQNMARNLPPEAQDIPQDMLEEAGKNIAEEMLQKAQEIQDLAQTGAHEAAAQKLQELQKMLDEMRQMKPMTEEQKADLQTLKQMREMIEKQEKLQEQTGKAEHQSPQQSSPAPAEKPKPTYASPRPQENPDEAGEPQQQTTEETHQQGDKTGQPAQGAGQEQGQTGQEQAGQGQAGNKPDAKQSAGASQGEDKKEQDLSAGGLQQKQRELRQELGKMVDDMANRKTEPPEQLGKADQGMKAAGEKLGEENWSDAKQAQGKTLDALKDMAGKLKRQLQSQIKVLPSGGSTGKESESRDPFSQSDKEKNKGAVNGNVKVPDKQEVQRARKILDELRRRSGEYERPKDERSYIERLLNKF
jgi:uncharacterized protein (TIGR02302 family)